MRIEGSEYHLSDAELMALVAQLGLTWTPLSPLVPSPAEAAVAQALKTELAALSPSWRTALEEAVRMLAAPTKVVR
ncbi:MAG: hypothetical protein WCJ97_12665, partial [Phycisphaerae bacterium]